MSKVFLVELRSIYRQFKLNVNFLKLSLLIHIETLKHFSFLGFGELKGYTKEWVKCYR